MKSDINQPDYRISNIKPLNNDTNSMCSEFSFRAIYFSFLFLPLFITEISFESTILWNTD